MINFPNARSIAAGLLAALVLAAPARAGKLSWLDDVVQGGELARGQAAFRLEFQVAQTRPGGQ